MKFDIFAFDDVRFDGVGVGASLGGIWGAVRGLSARRVRLAKSRTTKTDAVAAARRRTDRLVRPLVHRI